MRSSRCTCHSPEGQKRNIRWKISTGVPPHPAVLSAWCRRSLLPGRSPLAPGPQSRSSSPTALGAPLTQGMGATRREGGVHFSVASFTLLGVPVIANPNPPATAGLVCAPELFSVPDLLSNFLFLPPWNQLPNELSALIWPASMHR